jgi:hypothetical protein
MILTDDYAGICLLYKAIHGEEDKIQAPKDVDELDLISNFNTIFNV